MSTQMIRAPWGAQYVGEPYTALNCWELVVRVFQDTLGQAACPDAAHLLRQLCEVWYREEPEITVRAHDVLLFARGGAAGHHVGIALSATEMLHSTPTHGVVIEPLQRWLPYLLQVARHQDFMTPGNPPPYVPPVVLPWDVTLVTVRLLTTPIMGRNGVPHEVREQHPPGSLLTLLPVLQTSEYRLVYHNGRLVDEDALAAREAQRGDEVLSVPTWGISASVAIGIAVSIALSVGLSALSMYLDRPGSTNQDAEEERSFTFAGAQSRFVPGGAVPYLYGRRRLGLDLGLGFQTVEYAATIRDRSDPTVAVNTRLVLSGRKVGTGVGRFDVSEIEAGKPKLRPFVGQRVKFIGTADRDGFSRIIKIRLIPHIQSRGFPPVIINLWELTISGLTAGVGSLFTEGTIEFTHDFSLDAVNENSTLSLLGLVCKGPVSALHVSSLEINGQPLDHFPEVIVQTRLGTTPQPVIGGIGGSRVTIGIGDEIVRSPVNIYTTSVPVDAFTLNIDFLDGLVKFDSTGDRHQNRVRIQYRFQRDAGAFTPWILFEVTGNSLSSLRMAVRREQLRHGYYTIQTRFVHADSQDLSNAAFRPTLTSIDEITNGDESYDGFALVYLEGIPAERIDGQIPTVTIVADGTPVRVGAFAATPRFSNNNAWCLMDMLTRFLQIPDSKINLAAFLTYAAYCDQQIPTVANTDPGLIAVPRDPLAPVDPLDTRYGFRRKHTVSYLLEAPTREQTIVQEMTGSSRMELLFEAGQWAPRILQDESPNALFTTANVSNMQIRYIKDLDQLNVIDVAYNDKDNNWERTTISFPALEDQPAVVYKASADLRDVDNYDAAIAQAQFLLKQAQAPKRRLQFTTNLEGFPLQAFDLIHFAHEMPAWGESGRAAAGSTLSTIVLDQSVTAPAGPTYHIYVRFPDDTNEVRTMTSATVNNTVITVSPDFSQAPTQDTTLWAFGESVPAETAVIPFRVSQTPEYEASSGQLTVQCIEHVASIFTDADAVAPPSITRLPNFRGLPPAITSLLITEYTELDNSGTRFATAQLSWGIDRLTTGDAPYAGALIQRRDVQSSATAGTAIADEAQADTLILPAEYNVLTDFETVGEAQHSGRQWTDRSVFPGGTYQYRVIPISSRRVVGLSRAAYLLHHASGVVDQPETFRPETPQNLRLVNRLAPPVTALIVGDISDFDFTAPILQDQLGGVKIGEFSQDTIFEGPDAFFEWDPPANSEILKSQGLLKDWCVEIWGTDSQSNLAYRLYPGIAQPDACVIEPRFAWTQALNADAVAALGLTGPLRTVTIRVWARTTLGMLSAVPAQMTVSNPAPDMSSLALQVGPISTALVIDWRPFVAPRDIASYRVLVDTVNPPRQTGALVDTHVHGSVSSFTAADLGNVQHAVQVVPFDTFGVGTGTSIVLATPTVSPQQWSFFLRSFSTPDIVFTAVDASNSFSWTSGTLNYTDRFGDAQAPTIAAGGGVQVGADQVFVYFIEGESQFRTSQDMTVVFRADRVVIATYSGGATVTEVYGAKMSGTDIIAATIGAGQMVVGELVITESLQLGPNVVTQRGVDQDFTGDDFGAGSHQPLNDVTMDLTDVAFVICTASCSPSLAQTEDFAIDVRRLGSPDVIIAQGRGNQSLGSGEILRWPASCTGIDDTSALTGSHDYEFNFHSDPIVSQTINVQDITFTIAAFKR